MSTGTTALSHIKPASAGTSRESRSTKGHPTYRYSEHWLLKWRVSHERTGSARWTVQQQDVWMR